MLIQETSVALLGWFALSMTAQAFGLLMNLSPWAPSMSGLVLVGRTVNPAAGGSLAMAAASAGTGAIGAAA